MQIIRTDVSRATSLTGEPVLRVLFCGEGGDCVTVDMASVEAGNDDDALERARAILIQTATFSMAANEYDARSNGNFDELALTAASNDESGGIYIFEYRDVEGSRLVPPSKMPSVEAAQEEAVRCAIDLLADLEPGTDEQNGWLVRVRDEGGEMVCIIDVQQAEAARQARQRSAGAPVYEPTTEGSGQTRTNRVARYTGLVPGPCKAATAPVRGGLGSSEPGERGATPPP